MSHVFPAPALVIGVGRFGLATLERLGDDWVGLRLSGADVSLENLRLISVLPQRGGRDQPWWQQERDSVNLAHYLGDGDLPSLAFDFAMLRSLGLVRYRDGLYQVALPRDAGVVEVEDPQHRERLLRRRYFEWVKLSPDPIVSSERLRHLAQRSRDMDLFLTPLLNRIKQGHSPQALLVCIGRCRALLEGRDPSPWSWAAGRPRQPVSEAQNGSMDSAWGIEQHLAEVPEPLAGWKEWIAAGEPRPPLEVVVPEPFLRRDADLSTPLSPADLLHRDWESTGWASAAGGGGAVVFHPLPLTPFRLGLFDHEGRGGAHTEPGELFRKRLQELGDHLHRGLIRLWVDLQRERITELDPNLMEQERRRDELGDSLQQSLEVLGELVVRPLSSSDGGVTVPVAPAPARRPSNAERELPAEPSRFLTGIRLEPSVERETPVHLLARRLAELGLEEREAREDGGFPLLDDVRIEALTTGRADERDGEPCFQGLAGLREALNRQVRQLYGFSHLSRYRNRPTRRPPRLTVFVIGDMSEPFTRAAVRPVLREVHAELLRAFTPIFESYREGFDRCLCVTPILWMPHPADPYQGEDLELNRCEEAAIIDAVHGVRRWVECVLPPGRRCIPQIFVNSRVTDTAALSLDDAVRQTRDFLSFQIRNDMSRDHWLRQTAGGSGGSDLFSSFSCYEIDFPALRCREYLANRLARECLSELKEGSEISPEPVEPFSPPAVDDLVASAREELGRVTGEAGEALAGRVRGRSPLTAETPFHRIVAAFDEGFERSLYREVWASWRELTGRLGRVDDLVDKLRLRTSRLVAKEVDRVRDHSDRLIEERAAEGGLNAAQDGFYRLRTATRDAFQIQERLRRDKEVLCERHAIPDLGPIGRARAGVLAAAERKPDAGPLRMGLVLWALLAMVLGAPLSHGMSYLLDLHRRPGLLELMLGPGGTVAGGLLLWLPVWAILRWHVKRRVEALVQAVESMAGAVRGLLWGSGAPPEREHASSIRSFLESRLELTGAVATRGFALRVLERAVADSHLAHRLVRSVGIQAHNLNRRSEDLGVRSMLADGGGRREDLRGLFDTRSQGTAERLIEPELLRGYYARRIGDSAQRELGAFLAAGGGFAAWREQACLSDAERLLDHCRARFEALVCEPISDQHFFAEEVGPRLVRFVARCYPNLGFGAGFKGYEGLDPDNVLVLADASLVIDHGLGALFHRMRDLHRERVPTTETMDVRIAGIRPNAAYMMSLVQGVRVHSLRNLRRFESFHNRVDLPDDRTFPLSHEPRAIGTPINPLTGYEEIGRDLALAVLRPGDREVKHG